MAVNILSVQILSGLVLSEHVMFKHDILEPTDKAIIDE